METLEYHLSLGTIAFLRWWWTFLAPLFQHLDLTLFFRLPCPVFPEKNSFLVSCCCTKLIHYQIIIHSFVIFMNFLKCPWGCCLLHFSALYHSHWHGIFKHFSWIQGTWWFWGLTSMSETWHVSWCPGGDEDTSLHDLLQASTHEVA